MIDEIEIEIGEVIDVIPTAVHGARAKAWGCWRYDTAPLRQPPDKRTIVSKPQAGGKIENIASLTLDCG